MKGTRPFYLLVGLAVLSACTKDEVSVRVDRIEISGDRITYKYHEVQYTAQAFRSDGSVISNVRLRWSSSRPDVATIDDNGKLTALMPGNTTIKASSGDAFAILQIQVFDNRVIDVDFNLPVETVISKRTALNATVTLESGLQRNGFNAVTWTITPAVRGRLVGSDFLAVDSGHVSISATAETVTKVKTMYIKAWEFIPVDPYLAQPAANAVVVIPVVIIRILPTADGVMIDPTQDTQFGGGGEISIEGMKARLLRYDKRIKYALEEGSKFRGYKNPSAVPYLGYRVVRYIDYYKPQPANFSIITKVEFGKNVYSPDYFKMWPMFGMQNLVNNEGVKEIWVWCNGTALPNYPNYNPGIHGPIPAVGGWESNMAGPYGDVSNSDRNPNDMPVYSKTYVVYQQNTRRTHAEALHNHGHQIEAQLSHINYWTFWGNFAGRWTTASPPYGRGGDTHFPPNAMADYDYNNTTLVLSDIEDWTPDNSGQKKMVNRDTWGNLPYNWPEISGMEQKTESQWYIYWWQNMPGYQNTISWSVTHKMRNWWEFIADWDQARATGKALIQPK